MPYENEIASGDSLIWLENSQALHEFEGTIQIQKTGAEFPPPLIEVPRRGWWPKRVFAIDGSNLTHIVKRGFPGAEAGLVIISVVLIKLDMLRSISPGAIPRPSIFHDMEKARTVQAVLPGVNVIHRDGTPPKDFFRQCVYETLKGKIDASHESLLETLRAISGGLASKFDCPADGCEEKYVRQTGAYSCNCARREKMFETDILRLHEYFKEDVGGGGDAHGRLRNALEALVLLNILRFFAEREPAYLADCAFVLDGPLAVDGVVASLTRPIRAEFQRLNDKAKTVNGEDIVVFGIEKTGRAAEHWERVDWSDETGPRSRLSPGTVAALNNNYIRRNIKAAGPTSKPHGDDTHYGRYVLYKTLKGEHVVLNTAMLNKASQDFDQNDIKCYPRLGDILDVMDQLATHLYRDGFMPLTRAHAHAAIPLKRGADIIKSLLEDGS